MARNNNADKTWVLEEIQKAIESARPADKTWLLEEIRKAIESARPKQTTPPGSIRSLNRMRDWSILAAAIGVIIAFTVATVAFLRVDREAQSQTKTEDRLEAMEKHLSRIDGSLDLILLAVPPASTFKELSGRIRERPMAADFLEVADTASEAQSKHRTTVPVQLIQTLGKECLEAAAKSTGSTAQLAWRASLALAGYRSSVVHVVRFSYSVGKTGVPAEGGGKSAIGQQPLDGMVLKNHIFSNTKVVYHGGPVQLENVTFENCTFEFDFAPNATQLLLAILTKPDQLELK